MQNANRPKISVVMPIYNQMNLMANAINSIINQIFTDWELIVVNDGSDDTLGLEGIVKSFNDDRIRLVNKKHEGLVVARNVGNAEAKADVIAVQDADDLSMPDRLSKCYSVLIGEYGKHPVDIVYHGAYINMWDKAHGCISRKYIAAPIFNKNDLLLGQNLTGWPVYRKSVWLKKPFRLETQFMYDWMMYLDWAFSDFEFKEINEGLYEYVRHDNSASIIFERDGRREKSRQEIIKIMKKEYAVEM